MLVEFLKGSWLKHPFHAVLVHIPMGLWPAALIFDLLSQTKAGGNALVQLSFYCIAFGLLVSFMAVPAGIIDWSEIKREKPAWKLGLYHMGLNMLVMALFSISLGLRIGTLGEATHVAAVPLAICAMGVLFLIVSAYLGGLMVFNHGIGVARFSKGKLRRTAEAGGANVPPEKGAA